MPTETRTFIGESGTQAFDGWAGFRIGQEYELHVERSDGDVFLMLAYHEHATPGAGLVMSEEQFEKWFRK
ncbi:MAG: hypothetical protein ACRYFZ_11875 [Janthinobacterium lividum]